MRKTLEKIKERKAITLIALVVTIVVILILAGITISLLLDENGIIAKSKCARLENRAAQVEDEFGMWRQNNFINKESNQAQEEADTILASLISRKLLKEDEIDRENEIITIKKNDGSILKQISYSKVTINISKNPETEKSGAVFLTVDSVEGMTSFQITNEEEINNYRNFISSLSEEQKKEIIKKGHIRAVNLNDSTANCETFQQALEWFKKNVDNWNEETTEESFWNNIDSEEKLSDTTFSISEVFYNTETEKVELYTVTNPDGKISNTYIATENGTYTFKVQDIITGKTYTKKVEVTNIDETMPLYKITLVRDSVGIPYIYLLDLITQEYTTFEKAYIILNGEDTAEIPDSIIEQYDENGYSTETNVKYKVFKADAYRYDIGGTTQIYILIKDGILYKADIEIPNWCE